MKKSTLLLLAIVWSLAISAQFTPTSGPSGGAYVRTFLKDGSTIWAAIQYQLYKSTDQGGTWTKVIVDPNISDPFCIVKAGGSLFTAWNNGKSRMYKSSDGGSTWAECTTGLPAVSGYATYVPTQMTVINDTLFLGTTLSGVLKSADNGSTWTPTLQTGGTVNTVFAKGDTLIIGGAFGKPKWSVDNGKTFTDFAADLYTIGNLKFNNCVGIDYRNGRLFMVTTYAIGLVYSDDWGATWKQATGATSVNTVCVAGTKVYTSSSDYSKFYVSTDNGSTFTEEQINGNSMAATVIYDDGNLVWMGGVTWSASVGTTYYGVHSSSNARSASWDEKNKGLGFMHVTNLVKSGSDIFALIKNKIYKTVDNGSTWALADANNYNHIYAEGTTIYASHDNGLMKSTDRGATWTAVGFFTGKKVTAFWAEGQLMLEGGYDASSAPEIWISTDGGANWTAKPLATQAAGQSVTGFHKHATTIWIAERNKGFSITTDGGSTWTWSNPLNFGGYFASQGNRLLYQRDNEMYMSENNGASFRKFREGLTGFWPQCGGLVVDGGKAYVYSTDGSKGLYGLASADTVWKLVANSDGMPDFPACRMVFANGKTFAAPKNNSVWMLGGTGNGIDEVYNSGGLAIYPNPTNGLLNMELTGYAHKIQLIDLQGKLILTHKVLGQSTRLDVSNLESGMYILKVVTDNKNELVRRLIKN